MSNSSGFVLTHVAPRDGLQAWREPDPAGAVVATLQAGTQLQLLERRGAWAKVAFSNGWAAWVDGRRIVDAAPVTATPPAPAAQPQPAQPQPQPGQPQPAQPQPGQPQPAQPQPGQPQAGQPQIQAARPQPQPGQPQPAQPQIQAAQPQPQPQLQPQARLQPQRTQPEPGTAHIQAPRSQGQPSLDKGPARSKQTQSHKPKQAAGARPSSSPSSPSPFRKEPPTPPRQSREAEPAPAPSPAPSPAPGPGAVRGRLSAIPAIASIRLSPALIGAAAILLGTILSWIRVAGTKSNAYDVPMAFLWDYEAGSDGGIKVGLLLLALAIFVAVFSILPGQVTARRALGGAAAAIAIIYTIQLQRALSALGDNAPSLPSAMGFGVLFTVAAGVAIALDRSEPSGP